MSRIAIIGGHGQIALHLTRILSAADHDVVGVVRNPDHEGDITDAGGTMAVVDLEEDDPSRLADAITGADAVVFAAGSGPDSGAERKWTVDRDGAVRLVAACEAAGVDRYVMVSSMGTDDPPDGDEVFEQYLRAKAEADRALMASDLAWTVLRPGGLTDDEATGQVTIDRHVEQGEVPRADVAAVLAALLERPESAGHVLELTQGSTSVADAVAAAAGS